MMPTYRDLSHWEVDGDPFQLECTDEVIEQLRQWSLTADLFPPQRGTLWGKQEGHTVVVSGVSWHALSEDRKTRKPVGWFQIRLGEYLQLEDDDVAYCNKHFSAPGGTVLILKPEDGGSVRVGVFFRELDGTLRSESSYREAAIAKPADAFPEDRAIPVPLALPLAHSHASPHMPPRQQGSGVWMAFLTGALAGAVAFAVIWRVHATPAPMLPLDAQSVERKLGTSHVISTVAGVDVAVARRTHELLEQTRQLQTDLEAEKVHNRRLEVTLEILRDRLRIRSTAPTPISNQAKAQRSSTPLF